MFAGLADSTIFATSTPPSSDNLNNGFIDLYASSDVPDKLFLFAILLAAKFSRKLSAFIAEPDMLKIFPKLISSPLHLIKYPLEYLLFA
jgi:hypothetical protein